MPRHIYQKYDLCFMHYAFDFRMTQHTATILLRQRNHLLLSKNGINTTFTDPMLFSVLIPTG